YPGSTKGVKVHTVRKGESISVIAKKYGVTTSQIMRLNGLKKPVIFAGQSLVVSGTAKAKGKSKASVANVKLAKSGKPAVAKVKTATPKGTKAKVGNGKSTSAKAKL